MKSVGLVHGQHEVALALMKALGLKPEDYVESIDIHMDASSMVTVKVTKLLPVVVGEELVRTVDLFDLVPHAVDNEPHKVDKAAA